MSMLAKMLGHCGLLLMVVLLLVAVLVWVALVVGLLLFGAGAFVTVH